MGAVNFYDEGVGKTAKEAFDTLTDIRRREYGSGGYTGTIAEKHEFAEVHIPKGKRIKTFLCEIIEGDRFQDKWGPAGCIEITRLYKKNKTLPRGQKAFAFFGVASE